MQLSTGSQTSAVPSAASCERGKDAVPTSVRPVMGESPTQISSTCAVGAGRVELETETGRQQARVAPHRLMPDAGTQAGRQTRLQADLQPAAPPSSLPPVLPDPPPEIGSPGSTQAPGGDPRGWCRHPAATAGRPRRGRAGAEQKRQGAAEQRREQGIRGRKGGEQEQGPGSWGRKGGSGNRGRAGSSSSRPAEEGQQSQARTGQRGADAGQEEHPQRAPALPVSQV